ncbi:hypothetical protein D3C71_2126040 [compost metagenome]
MGADIISNQGQTDWRNPLKMFIQPAYNMLQFGIHLHILQCRIPPLYTQLAVSGLQLCSRILQ